MSRSISELQTVNVEAQDTRPVYVVAWEHSGTEELLSASGDITLDGKNYAGGGIEVNNIVEGVSATFSVYPSPARVMEVQNSAWRGGTCKLYYIPGSPSDDDVYLLTDAILLLDGLIDRSQYSGSNVSVTAVHINFVDEYTPRHLVSRVSNHIPAAGTAIVWESGRYILEARASVVLTEPISPITGSVLGRPTAADLQAVLPPAEDSYKTYTAENSFIRINYGRVPVPGDIFAQAIDGTDLIVGVVWNLGEIQAIDKTYIDNEATPSGVQVRNYRGKLSQIADSWLVDAITAYSDTMILDEPSGSLGVAYSVFKIPSGVLDRVPTSFTADGRWKLVNDPADNAGGDPHASNAGFSIEFTGADASTSATDDGPTGHTISFYGNAQIQSNQLAIDATGDSVQVDSAGINLADNDFTLEIKATPDVINTTTYLINKGSSSIEGFVVYKVNAELRISISSTGTSWDVASGAAMHTLADTSEFYLTIERFGDWFVAYVDGVEVWSLYSEATVFESTEYWTIGSREDVASSSWRGTIRVARLTIGQARYQVPHTATATPFADDGLYTGTAVYSDTTALCLADLATNEIYGLGGTTDGLAAAALWNDELALDGVARARIGISLSDPKRTMDLINTFAMYADCLVFNEGTELAIRPDKAIGADNPSGQNVALDSAFDAATGWTTLGDGWSVSGGLGVGAVVSPQAASAIGQTVVTEVGTQYAITIDLVTVNAGSVAVEFDGGEVIAGKTVAGTYTALVTATGTTAVLEAIKSVDFDGEIDNFRVDRLFYLTTKVVGQSISLRGLSDQDAITRVTAKIKVPSDTSGSWADQSLQYSLPGVDLAEAALRPTSLALPGVFREQEGNNKASQMLQRSVNQTVCTWISKDDGILHQKGNVVHLKLDNHGISEYFWVNSVTTIEAARYSVVGVRYDPAHYPSELLEPANAGVVPDGAIVMLAGTTVPAGWAEYTDANGRFIIGAGDTYAPTDTAGSATAPAFAADVADSDSHDAALESMNALQPVSGGGAGSVRTEYTAQGFSTVHTHTKTTGTITPDLYRRENVLIQKTGGTTSKFPVAAMPFGLPGIVIPNCARVVTAAGRLLQAASANANMGLASQFIAVTTGSTSNSHAHYITQSLTNRKDALDSAKTIVNPLSGGGSHTHYYNFLLTRSIKRNTVALYGGTDDFSVAPGMMVLWAGAIVDIPADWYLCDGTNSTQDLTDHFIEISAVDGENVSSGDNTLSINSYGTPDYHDHDNDTSVQQGRTSTSINHSNQVPHSHLVSESQSWLPECFALAMIMFNP